jgi:hypothetical protein
MAVTSVVQVHNGRTQWQHLVHNVIEYEAVWDPDSVNSNSAFHEDVTVPGATLGDIVWLSFDQDVEDVDLVSHVTAADTVTIGVHNPTAGAVNLGSGNLHIIVIQMRHRHQ